MEIRKWMMQRETLTRLLVRLVMTQTNENSKQFDPDWNTLHRKLATGRKKNAKKRKSSNLYAWYMRSINSIHSHNQIMLKWNRNCNSIETWEMQTELGLYSIKIDQWHLFPHVIRSTIFCLRTRLHTFMPLNRFFLWVVLLSLSLSLFFKHFVQS